MKVNMRYLFFVILKKKESFLYYIVVAVKILRLVLDEEIPNGKLHFLCSGS